MSSCTLCCAVPDLGKIRHPPVVSSMSWVVSLWGVSCHLLPVLVTHLKKSHLAFGSPLLPPGLAHTQNCLRWLGPSFFTVLRTQGSLCPLQSGGLGGPVSTLLQASLNCCWDGSWGETSSVSFRGGVSIPPFACGCSLGSELCKPGVASLGLGSSCKLALILDSFSSSVLVKNESSVCEEFFADTDFDIFIAFDGGATALEPLFTGFLAEDGLGCMLAAEVSADTSDFFLVRKADSFCCFPANSMKWLEQREGRFGEGDRVIENSANTGQWSDPSTCSHTSLVLRWPTNPTLARM